MKTPIPDGWPRRMADWEGRKVRTLREIVNGYMVIPAGTVATITRARSGVTLRGDACGHCGVAVSVSRVNPVALQLLPKGATT